MVSPAARDLRHRTGDGTELDVETDTYLHDSELAFSGELDYRFDEWTFRVLGTTFSTSGEGVLDQAARVDGVVLAPGDDWSSSTHSGPSARNSITRSSAPSPTAPFPGASPGRFWERRSRGRLPARLPPQSSPRFPLSPTVQTFVSTSGGVDYEHDGGVAALILGALIEVEIDTRPVLPSWCGASRSRPVARPVRCWPVAAAICRRSRPVFAPIWLQTPPSRSVSGFREPRSPPRSTNGWVQ